MSRCSPRYVHLCGNCLPLRFSSSAGGVSETLAREGCSKGTCFDCGERRRSIHMEKLALPEFKALAKEKRLRREQQARVVKREQDRKDKRMERFRKLGI